MENLISRAANNLRDILCDAIHLESTEQTLVVFDTEAPLTKIMTEAYHRALPTARFLDVASESADEIIRLFDELRPGNLVILVQSTNFRLNEFRLRLELFKRELKTIEHVHLSRMIESQFATYIESLAFDQSYYQSLGHALKTKLDQAQKVVVECKGTKLIYDGPMEESKLNIGDYSGMKNIGGTFPIGEVFTEPRDLLKVNGEALVFGFAGDEFLTKFFTPFLITIRDGVLIADEGPPEFKVIVGKIKEAEQVLVREFGLGINPAMDKNHMVNDVTAFERQKGLHLSLGAKHGLYLKPGLSRKKGRYHVDIFIDAEKILIDNEIIYEGGRFY